MYLFVVVVVKEIKYINKNVYGKNKHKETIGHLKKTQSELIKAVFFCNLYKSVKIIKLKIIINNRYMRFLENIQ